MEKEFLPYEFSLKLKALGFDEPCIYAWCITPKHRIEYKGEASLYTDGNPFGEFFTGKNWNIFYDKNKNKIQCSAPTFSQAFRWFREKYGIMHRITSYAFGYQIHLDNTPNKDVNYIDRRYDSEVDYGTYEEAELACLTKLIEIAETRTK